MLTRDQLVALLYQAVNTNNLAFADMAARLLLEAEPANGELWIALAIVAYRMGDLPYAREYLARAESLALQHPVLPELRRAIAGMAPVPRTASAYLVIRPWGYGFWSDVDHVLGQLLVAEIAGRTPLVCWGPGSRFVEPPGAAGGLESGWDRFFDPVSTARLPEVLTPARTYFPPVYSAATVAGPQRERFRGPFARLSSHYLLHRPEAVVISDFHSGIHTTRHWIPAGYPLHGKSTYEIYRYLAGKYLRPRARLAERIDAFAREHFAGAPVVGVHVRATDKVREDPDLAQRHAECRAAVDAMLAARPGARVFLLTDSARVLAEYRQRYGDRLITTACTRSASDAAVHATPQPSPGRIGEEVFIDAYLATRCDAFVGIGSSNVSCAAWYLRDWPAGACRLVGDVVLIEQHNLYLFMPAMPPPPA